MSTPANTPSSRPTPAKGATTRRSAPKRSPRTTKAASATSSRRATGSRRSTAKRQSPTRRPAPTNTVERVGGYAERAVLIPVGAALVARDRLVAGVGDLPRRPSDANAKAKAQLRRFERRGTSARNSLEREARRTRVRVERELRRRRTSLDRAVSRLDRRRSSLSRKVTGQVEEASTQFERTVQARVKDAASLAGRVQDRVLDLL